jgi:hypothetical protein
MRPPPSIPCPIHGVDFTCGATFFTNGESPRRHLRCAINDCPTRAGKYCARCHDFIVNTQRRPDHDSDPSNPLLIFAAWICPVCDHNQFEVVLKPGAHGQAM